MNYFGCFCFSRISSFDFYSYFCFILTCPQDISPHFMKQAKIWMNFIFIAYKHDSTVAIPSATWLPFAAWMPLGQTKKPFSGAIGLLRATQVNNFSFLCSLCPMHKPIIFYRTVCKRTSARDEMKSRKKKLLRRGIIRFCSSLLAHYASFCGRRLQCISEWVRLDGKPFLLHSQTHTCNWKHPVRLLHRIWSFFSFHHRRTGWLRWYHLRIAVSVWLLLQQIAQRTCWCWAAVDAAATTASITSNSFVRFYLCIRFASYFLCLRCLLYQLTIVNGVSFLHLRDRYIFFLLLLLLLLGFRFSPPNMAIIILPYLYTFFRRIQNRNATGWKTCSRVARRQQTLQTQHMHTTNAIVFSVVVGVVTIAIDWFKWIITY